MSTKIYNAYKFNGTAPELMEHLRSYRKKWHEFQAERIAGFHIELTDGDEYHKKMVLADLIREQSKKQFASWNDTYDVRGSVSVYFVGKSIYVQVFTQTEGVPPQLIDDRFEDFHYQNQCDPWYALEFMCSEEKERAEKNWKEREMVWEKVFNDELPTPVQAGLSYDFVSDYEFHLIADMVRAKR